MYNVTSSAYSDSVKAKVEATARKLSNEVNSVVFNERSYNWVIEACNDYANIKIINERLKKDGIIFENGEVNLYKGGNLIKSAIKQSDGSYITDDSFVFSLEGVLEEFSMRLQVENAKIILKYDL